MSTISGEVGTVGILNVGHGDTKISFDPENPQDAIRAARIVRDMLRRGYALLVQVEGGKYQRAFDFDDTKHEYIIADLDPVTPSISSEESAAYEPDAGGPAPTELRKPAGTKRVPAAKTRAVAVGPRAGG